LAAGVEVIEDSTDNFGLDDESENSHPCPASRAVQRIDLVDPVDELSPPFAQSAPRRRVVVDWP